MTKPSNQDRSWGDSVLDAIRELDAVIEVDGAGAVIGWNDRAARLFGVHRDDTSGEESLGPIVADDDEPELARAIRAAQPHDDTEPQVWRGSLTIGEAVDRQVRADVTVVPGPVDEDGSSLVVIHVPPGPTTRIGDRSGRGRPSAAAEPGGLVSPELFINLLDSAYMRRRKESASLAVLRVDIDPPLRDPAPDGGLAIADACRSLCQVAGEDGVVTALPDGGFAMLLDALDAHHHAVSLADRVTTALRHRLAAPSSTAVTESIRIGIGFLDDDGINGPDDIRSHAAAAAARAAETAGDRTEVYDPRLHEEISERRQLRDELYQGIDAGDFRVHYQPVVDLASGAVTVVEALVRWEHSTRGLVAAGEFIHLAEEHDLILPLGAWVLNEAASQAAAWLRTFGDRAPIVAVNFSAGQLHHPAAVELLAGVVDANGIDPRHLCIEVTESTLMLDPDRSASRLRELRALGVTLSIDRFGAGSSSFAYLQQFPVDLVKVDRSFIDSIDSSEHARAVATAIVHVAHSLDLAVVAEGIETAAQVSAIRALGFDHAQGFFLGRPQPPADLAALVVKALRAD